MRHAATSLSIAAALLAFGTTARAQVEQGTITGTVFDQAMGVVPGVRVVATETATNVSRETLSTGTGNYTLPYLKAGTYIVRAELPGFTPARVDNVRLRVGLTVTVNLVLKPGGQTEQVTVTAATQDIEVQTASLGTVISQQQLVELPIVGRNPYNLVALAPGVSNRGNAGTGPVISGARSNSTEVLLDGAETRNATTNDLSYGPPLESVEEFRVITNGLAAEFGRTGAGVITVATRSGTNALKGSLYGYMRRDRFNANSWSNNRNGIPRGYQHNNDFGLSLGGPVRKDKSFFFLNVERNKSQNPRSFAVTVPTLKQRNGDFSDTRSSSGALITIYDPLTTRLVGTTYVRSPFPGNVIPANRIDPIAKKILEYYPLPTNGNASQNFTWQTTRTSSQTPLVARVDHYLGNQRLFAAFRMTNSSSRQPSFNVAWPDPGSNHDDTNVTIKRMSAVLSDTVVFRPTLVGEFRLSRTRAGTVSDPHTLGLEFSSLGIGADDPGLLTHAAGRPMFPRIEVGGVTSLGMSRAGLRDETQKTTELQGHLTWVNGGHTLKAGINLAHMALDVFRAEYPSGQYSFGAGFTQGPNPAVASSAAGFGLATFLLGAPTGGGLSNDPVFHSRQFYYAPYVQDDWKITRSLTLNLGLRYEFTSPWFETDNQLMYFDTQAPDPATGRPGVLKFAGRDGATRYLNDPDRNNIAPRLGLAWRFREATVLRGAYGIVYYPGNGGIGSSPTDLTNGGYLFTTPVNLGPLQGAVNTPPPGASLRAPFRSGYLEPPSLLIGTGMTTNFRDLVTPWAHIWNVSLQHRLPWGMIGEVAYLGSRGHDLWQNLNRNVVAADALAQGAALDDLVPNPFFGRMPAGASADLTGPTVRRAQLLKPFPQYTGVTRGKDSVGDSWYKGLTARLEKHSQGGVGFQLAYTLSRMVDTVRDRFGSRGNDSVDPNDLGKSKSVNEDDRTHVLTGHIIWELPFGKGRRWINTGLISNLVGNWRLSAIGTYATGWPILITGARASNGTTGLGAYANRVAGQDPALPRGEQTLDRWFNTAAFAQPDAWSLGTNTRTNPEVRGPKVTRIDMLLSRTQRFSKVALELRIEAENALNTPQFALPSGSLTSVDYGKITSADGGRRVQVGARLSF